MERGEQEGGGEARGNFAEIRKLRWSVFDYRAERIPRIAERKAAFTSTKRAMSRDAGGVEI